VSAAQGDEHMLVTLLKQIGENRISSISDLSRQLGISEAFLNQLIAELVQREYLEALITSPNCRCRGGSCSQMGCTFKSGGINAYEITGRGRSLLRAAEDTS